MTIAIILFAIMLTGETLTYAFNPYSYDSDVRIYENGVEYVIESSVSSEYDVLILDHGETPPIDELIILSNGDVFYERITIELAIRGFNNLQIMDHSEIVKLAGQPSSRKGMLIPYGDIPKEIYSGMSTDPLVEWLRGGGTVYWFGCDSMRGYDLSLLGLSEDDFWSSESSEDYHVNPTSPFCKSLKFRNNSVRYGLSADAGTPLAYVSESGFSSITSVEILNGTMIVFGGGNSNENFMDCAQIIASGIAHDTELVEHEGGAIMNSKDGSIKYLDGIDISSFDNIFVYIYIGGYFIVYGERYN